MTASLADIVGPARCLLIDFDGPICSIFAGYPASIISAHLHDIIRAHSGGNVPSALAAVAANPLLTLREVDQLGDPELMRAVADASRDAEITAAATATPTPGAEDVLRVAHQTGRQVAIVSNNATAAIESYLRRHDLLRYADGIVARVDGMPPRLLKPDPFLVERGLATAHATPDTAVFIGDSLSDIAAGQAAGVPTIGYANKAGKQQPLIEAGAVAIIHTMTALADALQPAEPT